MQKIEVWSQRTTAGVVSKGCFEKEGSTFIVKGCSGNGMWEPLSECLASKVFALFVDSVDYTLEPAKEFEGLVTYDYPYVCVCKKVNGNLTQFYNYVEQTSGGKYVSQQLLLKKIEALSLDKQRFMSLLLVDALIGNTDRHWNNIDIMVTRRGLTWAPALDFGASLLYNVIDGRLKLYSGNQIGPDSSKPFSGVHRDNIKKAFKLLNVQNKKLLKDVKLSEILIAVYDAYTKLPEGACSEKRIESIISYLRQRYPVYIEPYIDK